jgi:hypothetical protein
MFPQLPTESIDQRLFSYFTTTLTDLIESKEHEAQQAQFISSTFMRCYFQAVEKGFDIGQLPNEDNCYLLDIAINQLYLHIHDLQQTPSDSANKALADFTAKKQDLRGNYLICIINSILNSAAPSYLTVNKTALETCFRTPKLYKAICQSPIKMQLLSQSPINNGRRNYSANFLSTAINENNIDLLEAINSHLNISEIKQLLHSYLHHSSEIKFYQQAYNQKLSRFNQIDEALANWPISNAMPVLCGDPDQPKKSHTQLTAAIEKLDSNKIDQLLASKHAPLLLATPGDAYRTPADLAIHLAFKSNSIDYLQLSLTLLEAGASLSTASIQTCLCRSFNRASLDEAQQQRVKALLQQIQHSLFMRYQTNQSASQPKQLISGNLFSALFQPIQHKTYKSILVYAVYEKQSELLELIFSHLDNTHLLILAKKFTLKKLLRHAVKHYEYENLLPIMSALADRTDFFQQYYSQEEVTSMLNLMHDTSSKTTSVFFRPAKNNLAQQIILKASLVKKSHPEKYSAFIASIATKKTERPSTQNHLLTAYFAHDCATHHSQSQEPTTANSIPLQTIAVHC